MVTKVASDRQGIQSVEVGFRLLRVLAATNRPMMLRDIAKGAGMPAAKALTAYRPYWAKRFGTAPVYRGGRVKAA